MACGYPKEEPVEVPTLPEREDHPVKSPAPVKQ